MAEVLQAPIVFFTGAGISVGSGLPTYRGSGGIYESGSLQPPSAADLSEDRLPALWQRFRPRLTAFDDLTPSAAHRAIAAAQSALPTDSIAVVTQNVDGLHSAAGSTRVIELHGNLRMVSCLADGSVFDVRDVPWPEGDAPRCPDCASMVRPGVVLFGERLPEQAFVDAEDAIARARTIVAVGTSAQVYPAADLIAEHRTSRARLIWVNPETAPPSRTWTWRRGAADDELVALLADSL